MLAYSKEVNCGLNEVFNVILLGDFHVGNVACREDKIAEMVEWIRTKKNCLWVDLGDSIEAINVSDKRWDGTNCPEWMRTADLEDLAYIQAERYINLVKPIKNKCIGKIEGNHEFKLKKDYKNDIHKRICDKLGIPNLGFLAMVRLKFKRGEQSSGVTLCLTHGAGASRKPGGKINKLIELSNNFQADVYVAGHCHDKINYVNKIIALNHMGELVEKKRILVSTASFFQTYTEGVTTYSERALYSPNCMGATRLYIKPFTVQREYDKIKKQMKWMKTLPPDIHIGE